MSAQLGGQPILILKEGGSRTRGRDAQSMNIAAAKAVAGAVRTTLGPKGMDKMLVDTIGDVVITNDGVTILKEMDIEHPAAKMMVEVSKTQDDEVGDGTTSAVVIAGELLKKSEELLEQDVHPTVITLGYRQAAEKAQELLQGIAQDVEANDTDILAKIAGTAMTGKNAEASKEKLCDLIVRAITLVADEDGTVDTENVKVEKRVGGAIEDSEIVEGMLIDKERVHPGMPKTVADAKILLLNAAVEYKKTEVDAEISITSPDQLQLFLGEEFPQIPQRGAGMQKVNGFLCHQVIVHILGRHMSAQNLGGVVAVQRTGTAVGHLLNIDGVSGVVKNPGAVVFRNTQIIPQERIFQIGVVIGTQFVDGINIDIVTA